MKTMRSAVAAAVFCVFLGCRTTGPIVELGGYEFRYKGKTYRIESVTPNYMEGYNVLMRKEGSELVLKAIDKEQDGILDEIVVGNLSLEEMNQIYTEGILEGERRSYIKRRNFTREYKTSDMLANYALATYILAIGEVYNRLTISNRQSFQNDVVVIDSDADGMLDTLKKGPGILGSYQKIYKQILEKGIREKRIVRTDKRYIVVM